MRLAILGGKWRIRRTAKRRGAHARRECLPAMSAVEAYLRWSPPLEKERYPSPATSCLTVPYARSAVAEKRDCKQAAGQLWFFWGRSSTVSQYALLYGRDTELKVKGFQSIKVFKLKDK